VSVAEETVLTPATVARLVTARTGLAFPPHRLGAVAIGVVSAMRKAGIADAALYIARLAHDGPVLEALIDELTVGETFFFRDTEQFDFIRRTILPDLACRHGAAPWISAWSAGCASGEEAYSLAILFEEEGVAARARILATDLSQAALAKARAGVYGAWSMRGAAGPPSERYFHRAGAQYCVAERLRGRIAFAPLNLATDPYPGRRPDAPAMDLILCRNVLIYLDAPRIAEVARRLFEALAEGGWLLTGPADPPLAGLAPFEVVQSVSGLVYRRPARAAPGGIASIPAAPPEDDAAPIEFSPPPAPPPPAAMREDAAAALDPLCAEGQLMHAIALMSLGDYEAAARAARRALYLDRGLAMAHLVQGAILWRLGDWRAAKHAYRTSYALAAALPPDVSMPCTEGKSAASLAAAARAQLVLLDRIAGPS
jgi:chemotaxis protein methyltransferase CheR